MLRKLKIAGFAMVAVVSPIVSAAAQSATEWVSRGNAAFDSRSASEAVTAYDKALASDPNNYEALWRISRSEVDLAMRESDADKRAARYKSAQEYASRAVTANPNGADGHFVLAEAFGRMALTMGSRDRIKYAGKIHDQAMDCLKLEPKHAGCLHVMGVWNAEIMRLNGLTRMIARNFLGGQIFGEASWPSARKYMEQAVTNDPRRIVHRLDLARVYADMGMTAQARQQYEAVVSGEVIDYNDPLFKTQATSELAGL